MYIYFYLILSLCVCVSVRARMCGGIDCNFSWLGKGLAELIALQ